MHAETILVPAPTPYGPAVSLPRNLVVMPRVKQQTNFSCGNAATLSMLRYWRPELFAGVEETALYAPLCTTRAEGTEPEPIAAFLGAAAQLDAVYRHGDVTVEELERAVDLRQPPIVDLQAWRDDELPWRDVWDSGHYVIMVGYDADRLFFMDPSRMTPGPYAYLLRSELDERWHDLAGRENVRLERMAIFVRGASTPEARNPPPGETATKLA
jgi:ABC-type bacteriocin/lantibiotic exporter with double-glycine peptidase domain